MHQDAEHLYDGIPEGRPRSSKRMQLVLFWVIGSIIAVTTLLLNQRKSSRDSLEESDIDYVPLSRANYQRLLAKVNASMKIAHITGEDDWRMWSHDEVREQVYSLMNQMEDLAGREFVDHTKATKDIETSGVRSNREQAEIVKRITALGEEMQLMSHNLGASLSSLASDTDQIYRRQGAYSAQQERDISAIEDALQNHSVAIQVQDATIDRNHGTAESELASLRREITAILDQDRSSLERSDEDNRHSIGEMRDLITAQLSRLRSLEQSLSAGLSAEDRQESRDFSTLDGNATALHRELLNHSRTLDQLHSTQQALRAAAAESAQRLGHTRSRLEDVAHELAEAEARQASDEAADRGRLQAIQAQGHELELQEGRNADALAAVAARATGLERDGEALRAREARDYGDVRAAQAALAADVARAVAVGAGIADLSRASAANATRIEGMLDGAAAARAALQRATDARFAELGALQGRIAALEEAGRTLAAAESAGERRVDGDVAAARARLSALEGLQGDVAAAEARYDAGLRDAREAVRAVDAAGNQTADEAAGALAALRASVAEQLRGQAGDVAAAQADAAALQGRVAELQGAQAAAADEEGRLAAQVADAGRAVSALGARYARLADDTGRRLDALGAAAAALPAAGTLSAAAAAAESRAAAAEGSLKALAGRVGDVEAREAATRGELQGLAAAVRDGGDAGRQSLAAIRAQLAGEGQILSNIARKLGDDDLQQQVNTVFP